MSNPPSAKYQPKRVILRLQVNKFSGWDYSKYINAINIYLVFTGRLTNNLEFRKHYAYIKPF